MNTPETVFIIYDQDVIKAEYRIIDSLLDSGYTLTKQTLSIRNNTFIDKLYIATPEGKFTFYFDISYAFNGIKNGTIQH